MAINDIAIYNGSSWDYFTPSEGWTTYVKDEDCWYVFDGSNWNKESIDELQSQVSLIESECSNNSVRITAVDSQLLLVESEVNDVSEALSQTISDNLVEKSMLNDVSELLSQVDSQLLLIESEAASNDSEILLLESECATNSANIVAAESELDLVSEANVATESDLLVEKSTVATVSQHTSQAKSDLLVEKSTVNDVSELASQHTIELASVGSHLLVEESTLNDVSEALSQTISEIAILTTNHPHQDVNTDAVPAFSGMGIGTETSEPSALLHLHGTGPGLGLEYLGDSSINHGMTDKVPTTVYGVFGTWSNSKGGFSSWGFSEPNTSGIGGLLFRGITGENPITKGAVVFRSGKKNGTTYAITTGTDIAFQFEDILGAYTYITILGNGKTGILKTPSYELDVNGEINADSGFRVNGAAGASGSFTTTDGKTVTVVNGIITSIV